ncbi:MAG: hypothetical protein R2941_02205 [Desulfobacterales bacterium]
MTTVEGLFTSGDGVACFSHKFSSLYAELYCREADAGWYAVDFKDFKPTLKQSAQELVDIVYKPVRTVSGQLCEVNGRGHHPNYLKPNVMMYRLMKATYEYGAGTTYYLTNCKNLEVVMDLSQTMRETMRNW